MQQDCQSAEVITAVAEVARTATRNSSKIRRFLWRYEHNDADIADIIQDAMVEALRCQGHFKSRASAQTWFFGIAANVARHHVARRARNGARTVSLEDMVHTLGSPDVPEGGPHAEKAPCPTRAIELQELRHQLTQATERLSLELRRTFDLAYVQEYSYQEVADALGIPIGTVRSRLNRARELLRETLAKGEGAMTLAKEP
jgi:RNA polymerase sigma-70 factor, ECF subfamily